MPSTAPSLETIKATAARWVTRLASGLSEAEEAEFAAWIEADPLHAEVLAEQQAVWDRYAALVPGVAGTKPDPDRFAPRRSQPVILRFIGPALAAAAAVTLGFILWPAREPTLREIRLVLPAPLTQQTLPDGSSVELNRGAEIAVAYSDTERRVSLVRGEANFTVAKNPEVPFIVSAGGVEVRAVGTAFNVRYDTASVEVVVSQGRVAVNHAVKLMDREQGTVVGPSRAGVPDTSNLSTAHRLPSTELFLDAGQSTLVTLSSVPSAPVVASLSQSELDARLAWQPRLLDFDDAPLAQIVAEFNQRNAVRLTVRDPALASLRLNASFRSDNMEGFVRLLAENFKIRAEPVSDSEIVLRRIH
ncbi:MAG TPA: hypothetical protein DCQ94_02495 [Nitrospira sp.]|nr:hypothetical protein [Nitrospira sp.]HRJ46129.1 FecR domain-containing protein [Opitutaceae bacterium]